MAMMRSSGSKARALGWLGKPCSTVCGRGEGICPGTAAPRPSRAHPRQPSGSAAATHWDTSRVHLCCACVVNPETGSHPPAGMEGLSPWAPPRAKPPSLSTPVSTPLCTGPWQQTKRKDKVQGGAGTEEDPICLRRWGSAPHSYRHRLKRGEVPCCLGSPVKSMVLPRHRPYVEVRGQPLKSSRQRL